MLSKGESSPRRRPGPKFATPKLGPGPGSSPGQALRRDDMRGSILPRFNARLRFIADQEAA
jgi:hypothetical protein